MFVILCVIHNFNFFTIFSYITKFAGVTPIKPQINNPALSQILLINLHYYMFFNLNQETGEQWMTGWDQ